MTNKKTYWKDQMIKEKPVRIPAELHKQFKASCASQGRTMSWVATQLIIKYLKEQNDSVQ